MGSFYGKSFFSKNSPKRKPAPRRTKKIPITEEKSPKLIIIPGGTTIKSVTCLNIIISRPLEITPIVISSHPKKLKLAPRLLSRETKTRMAKHININAMNDPSRNAKDSGQIASLMSPEKILKEELTGVASGSKPKILPCILEPRPRASHCSLPQIIGA